MSGADDVLIRTEGRAGRITLNRPDALNALTWDMCLAVETALVAWRVDDDVRLILIDGAGRAFCAGGDIVAMYAAGREGRWDYGQRFWADEYRLNAMLSGFPKPVASFMQGFTMGGGVGIGCHASHRIVGESSRVAMPECGIGLVPDVGGSLLLARAPGRLGEYLGTTATRMNAADAIHAGFADCHVPEADWPGLIADLARCGDCTRIGAAVTDPGASALQAKRAAIDRHFACATLLDIDTSLAAETSPFAQATRAALARVSPLSAAITVELIRRSRVSDTIEGALDLEYRVTSRSMEHGDFLEGIRALIIDKDHAPRWRHADLRSVQAADIGRMLMPPGASPLDLREA